MTNQEEFPVLPDFRASFWKKGLIWMKKIPRRKKNTRVTNGAGNI
jgi:hypothetical protein